MTGVSNRNRAVTLRLCGVCCGVCGVLQGLRLEMGAALAAGHADLEGREAAVKDAERRLAVQQVGVALQQQALQWDYGCVR